MGSVHPLHVFFQCFGLRGAWFAAFWGKTLLVLTTLPVTDRAPFLDSSSPTLPLPSWSLCQQRSVGDGTIMQVPAQTICLLPSLTGQPYRTGWYWGIMFLQ